MKLNQIEHSSINWDADIRLKNREFKFSLIVHGHIHVFCYVIFFSKRISIDLIVDFMFTCPLMIGLLYIIWQTLVYWSRISTGQFFLFFLKFFFSRWRLVFEKVALGKNFPEKTLLFSNEASLFSTLITFDTVDALLSLRCCTNRRSESRSSIHLLQLVTSFRSFLVFIASFRVSKMIILLPPLGLNLSFLGWTCAGRVVKVFIFSLCLAETRIRRGIWMDY